MTTAAELSALQNLQKLREERAKAEHARAVSSMSDAIAARTKANERLSASDEALTRYTERSEIELSQFQILAQRVSDQAIALHARNSERDHAIDAELEARSARRRNERLSKTLSDHHREAVRRERRKREDREAREFLSAWAQRKGERL